MGAWVLINDRWYDQLRTTGDIIIIAIITIVIVVAVVVFLVVQKVFVVA